MDFENCQPEENETNAWRAMEITWAPGEGFAPKMVRTQIGVRLLLWNGVEAHWVNPVLSAKDKSASWTGF
jgi:hypothetical protein